MIHSNFKLNGKGFSSDEELQEHAFLLTQSRNMEEISIGAFILEWMESQDFIQVKTSGSTGVPKNISLKKDYVFNSAMATVEYFKLYENTKALLCLSSNYIGGKMMLVRGMVAGWDFYTVDPRKDPLKDMRTTFDFTAMVPYQVFHSLNDLHKVKKIIIGGGVIPPILEKQLQNKKTIAFATYGMTETISHVAVRQANGKEVSDRFTALSHVKFSQTSTGCLRIHAPRISDENIETKDVVELLSPTTFKFLGRSDNVINSGGVKIHPENVEQKLSLHIDYPFFIASEKDDALGERIILIVESKKQLRLEEFFKAFGFLDSYERPKKLYVIPKFFYTPTDKIRRAAVLETLK